MAYVRRISALSNTNVSVAGGKGASLGEMTKAGIPVPGGFVVLTDAFERFMKAANLHAEVDAILSTVDHRAIHTVENASEKIESLIAAADIPDDIAEVIHSEYAKMKATYVAVRSSATAEDSAEAAWAGQLETHLNTTEKDVLTNVKKCWASLFSPRAIFYRFEKNMEKTKVSVAVVVQEMVESEVSGIAFSVHPVTQDRNQIIIEAGFGLGEAIVSGSITPDSFVIRKDTDTIIDTQINLQMKGLFRKKGGGSEWRDLQKTDGEKPALTEKEVKELASLVSKIEKHYGFPVDIEWARSKSRWFILQSRPITTLGATVATEILKRGVVKKLTKNSTDIDWVHYITRPFTLLGSSCWREWYGSKHIIDTLGVTNSEARFLEVYPDVVRYYREKTQMESLQVAASDIVQNDPKKLQKIFERGNALNTAAEKILKKGWKAVPNFETAMDLVIEMAIHATVVPFLTLAKFDELQVTDKALRDTAEHLRAQSLYPRFFAEIVTPHAECLAKKLGADPHDASLLTVQELRDKDISQLEYRIHQRKKGLRFIYTYVGGNETVEWTKSIEAEVLKMENITKKHTDILEGKTAFRGKVVGKARVVLTDNPKGIAFDKNDILVSINSTPALMPLIIQCAAMVTDEGGISCHAAIVSRELKKPCVMSTKLATSVIKDGDTIEVDANKGIVKVLKRA